MKKMAWALGALVVLTASTAFAQALVTMKGGKAQPGLVTAWSGSGKKVTLTVKKGTDASEVADAVQANVDGVKKTKVVGGKVLVIGLTEADLLKGMNGVELGGDDIGALAMASMGDDDEGSGSSLRAKKTAKVNKLFKDRKTVAKGMVVAVGGKKFPQAAVKVRILSGPTGALGKKIRKGKTVVFFPKIQMKRGAADLSDDLTQVNIGAWYLEKKDRVTIKIGKARKGGFVAEAISR